MRAARFMAALIVVLVALTAGYRAQQARDPKADAALQAAIKIETIDGNIKGAIDAYAKVVSQYGTNRPVAAQALARMAGCYEKLGAAQTDEARKTWERLARDYGDQKDLVAQAQARLAALGAGARSQSGPRLVLEGSRMPLSISGDGRYAYFRSLPGGAYWKAAGSAPLVIRDLATGAERGVTSPVPAAIRDALTTSDYLIVEMSPDGRQMAYALSRKGDKCVLSVASADGTNARTVNTSLGDTCSDIQWSDDGQRLFVAVSSGAGQTYSNDYVLIAISNGAVVGTVRAVRPTSAIVAAIPSPDGRLVAILDAKANDPSWHLSVIDILAKRENVVADLPGYATPVWTPDGTGILFVSGQPGERSLMLARLSGGAIQGSPELVRAGVGQMDPYRVSRDGTLFYRQRLPATTDWHLFTLDRVTGMVGASSTRITGIHETWGVDWSPDGSTIAYAARVQKDERNSAPNTLLVLRSVADSRETVISPRISNILRPKWSPDGTRIVVFGERDGVFGDYLIDVKSGTATLLVEANPSQTGGENLLAADWSPDGKGLFLGRIDANLAEQTAARFTYRIVYRDLATGVETERYAIRGPGRIFFTATSVSREGSLCLLVNVPQQTGGATRATVIVPAGGGPARTVLEAPIAARFSWAAWAADGRSIYVSQLAPTPADANARRLLRVPADGGEPVYVGVTLSGMDNLFPSPDGTRLLLNAGGGPASRGLWAIDNVLTPSKSKGK